MRLIAQRAWFSFVSVPPQLGGPDPVACAIEPDVSRTSTTYGLSGSPAQALDVAKIPISVAAPSHAKRFIMLCPSYKAPMKFGNVRRVAFGVGAPGRSRPALHFLTDRGSTGRLP